MKTLYIYLCCDDFLLYVMHEFPISVSHVITLITFKYSMILQKNSFKSDYPFFLCLYSAQLFLPPRVMLSKFWGSDLLVAQWQIMYHISTIPNLFCLCHAVQCLLLVILGHFVDYRSVAIVLYAWLSSVVYILASVCRYTPTWISN